MASDPMTTNVMGSDPWLLQSSSTREFSLLKTFLTEHGAALRRPERHRRFLAARRAGGLCFDAFANARRLGPGGPFGLAGLASLGLVLEILVREEELFTRRPHELRAAIHTREDLVLELHRAALLRAL